MCFNVLSTSRSENAPDSAETNEVPAVVVEQTGMVNHTQDMSESFDTHDIGLDELTATAEGTDNTNNTSKPGKDIDDNGETDYQADLKPLSNLKKYKINILCTQNLKEVVWSKLGENLEDRR